MENSTKNEVKKNFSNEEYLNLAKIAQKMERYKEMLEYVDFFVKTGNELTNEERSTVSAAYKNAVGNKRAEWRVLQAIKEKEETKENHDHINYIKKYLDKVENEMEKLCNEILGLIDTHLFPNSRTGESKVFFLKMKGDYFRYLSEFLEKKEYDRVSKNAEIAYLEAIESAKVENLSPTSPTKLGLLLNWSVFNYEILRKREEAVIIAKNAFDESIDNIEKVHEKEYKDCTLIMQLLRDNLTLWSNDPQMDEQNEEN